MPATPEPGAHSGAIRRVLGFDFGHRRIGIACGQTLTGAATPVTTLKAVNGNPDWAAIAGQIEQWRPDALLVGLPLHLDGSENAMTRAVEQFCNALRKRSGLPVITVDERLSSDEAAAHLQGKKKIGRHNKHEIDKMAAAIIVQRWLDQQ